MKCQHCGNQEADKHFVINWMGTQHELHLCEDCRKKLTEQYIKYTKRRGAGEDPFPEDAGRSIRRRRQLNALRRRLDDAVEMEQYETAARLRDEISQMEKEVLV